jgi:hypothetical protein
MHSNNALNRVDKDIFDVFVVLQGSLFKRPVQPVAPPWSRDAARNLETKTKRKMATQPGMTEDRFHYRLYRILHLPIFARTIKLKFENPLFKFS